jgi:UDP-glucose 4-epimerase
MRVGVTGGSGFIGSHVVDVLVEAGYEVCVLDMRPSHRPEASWRRVSILDKAALLAATKGLEALFHLAAVADVNDVARDPVAAVDLNVGGTARVLEAARQNGVGRVLLASTVWVYSSATIPDGLRDVDEETPVAISAARQVYTSSKLAAEMLCHDYWHAYRLPFTILRYGIPYGPRMRDSLVIPRFVQLAQAGQALTVAGDGSQHRKFVYVEDLARAHLLALGHRAENQTYNLDGRERITILQIAEAVTRLTGAKKPIEFVPARGGDYAGADVSSDKARAELNWEPQVGFAEGMKRTVAWLTGQFVEERAAAAAGR